MKTLSVQHKSSMGCCGTVHIYFVLLMVMRLKRKTWRMLHQAQQAHVMVLGAGGPLLGRLSFTVRALLSQIKHPKCQPGRDSFYTVRADLHVDKQ